MYATSSYPFEFHARSKLSPVSLIKYTVGVFSSVGYTFSVIYLDKVGDLARSDDFMIYCHDLHMTVKTTGGYK